LVEVVFMRVGEGTARLIRAKMNQGMIISSLVILVWAGVGLSLNSTSVYTDSSNYTADGKVGVFFSGPPKGNYRISVVDPEGLVAFDEYGWISPHGNGYTYVTGLLKPGEYVLYLYIDDRVESKASFTVSGVQDVCVAYAPQPTTTFPAEPEKPVKAASTVAGSSLTTDKEEYEVNESVFAIVFAPVKAQINLSVEHDGYVTYYRQEGTTVLKYTFAASTPGRYSIQAVVFDGAFRADLSKTIRVRMPSKPPAENASMTGRSL